MELACKTLGISPTASLETIRRKYKSLAKELHPDKGGSEDNFALIQQSYCIVLKEYKNSRNDKTHNELKYDYSSQNEYVISNKPDVSEKEMFHQLFEEYRTPSVMDGGYGHDMQESSRDREDIDKKI
jgi:curved DNA-binding protein CbpA